MLALDLADGASVRAWLQGQAFPILHQACVPSTAPKGTEMRAQYSSHPTAAISEWHMAGDHPLLSAIVSSPWQEHPEGDSSTHPGRGESPAESSRLPWGTREEL